MVRQLEAAPPPAREPIPQDRIDALEEILAEMRAGKVTAFAFAVKMDGYCTWFGWHAPKRGDCVNIIGQLRLIERDMVAAEGDS